MTDWQRTDWIADTPHRLGKEVVLNGWLQRRRDLGGLVFLELRDRSGVVQALCAATDTTLHTQATTWPLESVVALRGRVVEREPATVQAHLPTGKIEVQAQALHLFNAAALLPFSPLTAATVDEQLRLRYRYLDLRRPVWQERLQLRQRVIQTLRTHLQAAAFCEVETPLLTKSTPEGARDYLVPSRQPPGAFYALPQSPQLFKQLLMVAGLERYYQIARCFRDEDLRADRQPEFTQLDLELSFSTLEELRTLLEKLLVAVGQMAVGVTFPTPFPQLTYLTAWERYGTDRPDLRVALPIQEVSAAFHGTQVAVLAQAQTVGKSIQAIRLPQAAAQVSRRQMTAWEERARSLGAPGWLWFAFSPTGVKGPLAKHCSADELQKLKEILSITTGDLVVLLAGPTAQILPWLGSMRLPMAKDLGYTFTDYAPLWITEFPLWEREAVTGKLKALHHPFTQPHPDDLCHWEKAPERMRAQAFDLVLNGSELGSGGQRIHEEALQRRVLHALGWSTEAMTAEFGFLLQALASGAPPHLGFGLGIDRLMSILLGVDSLRDCLAFPKNAAGACPLTGAPAPVHSSQLQPLALRTTEQPSRD